MFTLSLSKKWKVSIKRLARKINAQRKQPKIIFSEGKPKLISGVFPYLDIKK